MRRWLGERGLEARSPHVAERFLAPRLSGAITDAPALVSGLDDVAVVGQAIEERGGHLGVAEHRWPFGEGEIGGHEYRGAFVEPADQMEQQLTAGLGERQVAEFVDDDEVDTAEPIGEPASAPVPQLGLEAVHQVNGAEEAHAPPVVHRIGADGDGEVRLARPRAADEDDVAGLIEEARHGAE